MGLLKLVNKTFTSVDVYGMIMKVICTQLIHM